MKNQNFLIIIILIFLQNNVLSQVGINATGSAPASNAMLDVSSTNKGVLLPRLSSPALISAPTEGMLFFNTTTNTYNYFDGLVWQNFANGTANNFWSLTGTSIYNNNSGNVGIGDTTPTEAKFVVNGAVSGQTALFKAVSGVSIGSTYPSVGFNYNNGKAITDGAGAILRFDPTLTVGSAGVLDLNFYKTKTAGSLFANAINVLKFQDFTAFGLGYWLDLNTTPNSNSRTNISDRLHSKSNGNLNLIPLGAIYFKVTGLGNGDNATTIIHNVGQNAELYQNRYYFNVDTGSGIGSGFMNLILNLDFITKSYNDVFIVGSPNFANYGEETQSAYAKFYRNPEGTNDRIQIWYGSSFLSNSTEVFGTLLVYGTKSD